MMLRYLHLLFESGFSREVDVEVETLAYLTRLLVLSGDRSNSSQRQFVAGDNLWAKMPRDM